MFVIISGFLSGITTRSIPLEVFTWKLEVLIMSSLTLIGFLALFILFYNRWFSKNVERLASLLNTEAAGLAGMSYHETFSRLNEIKKDTLPPGDRLLIERAYSRQHFLEATYAFFIVSFVSVALLMAVDYGGGVQVPYGNIVILGILGSVQFILFYGLIFFFFFVFSLATGLISMDDEVYTQRRDRTVILT